MRQDRLLRGIVLGLVLALASVLAGCGAAGEVDLDGSEWTLVELNGAALMPGTNITLSFEEGNAGGFAGCNAYGASYETGRGGALSIGLMQRTVQACLEPAGVMEQEDAYWAALQAAAAYRVTGDRLEIEDGAGGSLLAFVRKVRADMDPADLVDTSWRLVSLNGASPVEGSSITMAFSGEGQASGMAGCREYEATYEASGDQIGFPYMSMSGDESCLADDALYLQEGAFTDALTWTTNYRLSEGRLEIETARGERLVFEPLP